MEKMTVNVKGMSCGHCINSVEGNVGELSGVTTDKVNLDSGTVSVEFNPNEVSIDKIKETIDGQGYYISQPIPISLKYDNVQTFTNCSQH
ncbi:copper chaperone CopZ [Peribacillus sp. NPDC056705]|uniref:copper chaperone CopZ n=1 Tax=Peribacillus sp. NPDC056705 TaxID=3345918 RepID=UPI003749A9E8